MSRPKPDFVYLRHPKSRRVLELTHSPQTAEFLATLRMAHGYQTATAEDFRAQEERRWVKQRGGAA